MRRIWSLVFCFAFVLALAVAPRAQLTMTGVGGGYGSAAASYTGPGDVVSGATAFWGLRAYNGAYAASLGKIANICTPADALCADVNSDASGNFNLSGVGALVCNNSTSVCTIKTLYEQTGNAHNATNATAANRPILVINAIGSLVGASYNGTSQSLTETASTAYGNQPSSVSMVVNATSTSTASRAWRTSGTFLIGHNASTNTMLVNFGNSATFTIADGSWQAISLSSNGSATCAGRVNTTNVMGGGVDCGTGGPGTAASTIASNGVNFWVGSINEVGYWNTQFNSTQRTNMNSNSKTYWGF